jgi:hypothetical protein
LLAPLLVCYYPGRIGYEIGIVFAIDWLVGAVITTLVCIFAWTLGYATLVLADIGRSLRIIRGEHRDKAECRETVDMPSFLG